MTIADLSESSIGRRFAYVDPHSDEPSPTGWVRDYGSVLVDIVWHDGMKAGRILPTFMVWVDWMEDG